MSVKATLIDAFGRQLLIGVAGNEVCLCDWVGCGNFQRHVDKIGLRFGGIDIIPSAEIGIESPTLLKAVSWLDHYLLGSNEPYSGGIIMTGIEFQRKVWEALMSIEYGKTVSYKVIANRIGYLKGFRAVAHAIGENPISIFVPCHRVVGSDGSLTGFAGGLDAKRMLLSLEANH